jgi:AcrR family transcriptional regulator
MDGAGQKQKTRTRVRHANLSGQAMGTKGFATRRRLINALIELLGEVPLRELTVKSIAKAAGMSPATFYLYFRSVRECLHAATGAVSQSTPAILEVLARDWDKETGPRNAWDLAMDHLELWDAHRTLLRVRNLAAEEQDSDFVRQRVLAMGPAVRALAELAQRQQRGARLDPDIAPIALAGALFAMLDLMSAVFPVHARHASSVERAHIEAAAYVLSASLGCPGAAQ